MVFGILSWVGWRLYEERHTVHATQVSTHTVNLRKNNPPALLKIKVLVMFKTMNFRLVGSPVNERQMYYLVR